MKFDFGSLASQIEADWPVTVAVPQENGKVLEQKFNVRFRMVDDEELAAEGVGVKAQKEALRKVIKGLGKDQDQAFTPELLEQMLAAPYVRVALNQAYGEFACGMPAKNSETPPA